MKNLRIYYTRQPGAVQSGRSGRWLGAFQDVGAAVEEGLENQSGGNLIDDAAVLLAGVAGLIEDAVRLVGGQALVPEVDGQAGELAEFGGEVLGLLRLGAGLAGEMDWIADHQSHDGVAACQAGEGAQVFTAVAAAFQGEDRLGGKAELVADGHADAAIADVEAEVARMCGGFQS